MDESGWGVPHALLDKASPFHLVMAADLTVCQVGSSLRRLCPDLVAGRSLEDVAELVTPRVALTLKALSAHARSLFVFRLRGCNLTLRGQMLHDDSSDVMIFLGSPWITSMSAMTEAGLTLEDFAVSDSVVDYLLLLQTREAALAQARTLADSLRESAAELSRQALHDELTGLPNRRLLAERFEQALSEQGPGSSTGLLVMDLDGFKRINDTFGHQYGDVLLTQVGARLSGRLRDGDTLARLGGDEFAVLLPAIGSLAAALRLAATIRRAFEAPFTVAGLELEVDASVGVVLSGEHGQAADTLLRHADTAMYTAKANGGGIAAYKPENDANSARRLVLQGELRRAIQHRHLTLHYQPKVSVRTGEMLGAEALVRWQHPTRGMIPPVDFIPVAEHSGLIGPLTRHILDMALGQVRAWADEGRTVPVAVNISTRNLLDEGLCVQVADLLAQHRVPAGHLVLEVTESALMTDVEKAKRVLQELAALGVGISIDDFGAGYTSLGYLTTLPISELKVDRSFIDAMTCDRRSRLVVQSVITLGHNLGLTVVAEGVETEQTLEMLARMGCDSVQGYHLGRPLPASAFGAWTQAARPWAVEDLVLG